MGLLFPKVLMLMIPCLGQTNKCYIQGGRSCAGARGAPAEKFGLRQFFLAQTYAILSRIKICRNYALFGDLWAKKCLFGSKTVFLGQELQYYMVYIVYFTELILQICDYAQKRRI